MSNSMNVILVGEAGVGKSSVINLIAGREIARTSPDAEICAMSNTEYSLIVNGRVLHIWDTIGLDEPETGVNSYLPAIEQAHELIKKLTIRGGVDLLLFCVRGNGVTTTTQRYYRLFYEVLCRSQVPIALVITHLERELDMEGWWVRNVGRLENLGIKVAGHACVTGLPNHSKYRESHENITKMLAGHNGNGRFNMPAESLATEFLRSLGVYAAPLKKDAKRRDVLKILTKRCGFDLRTAEEIATTIAGY